MSTISRWSTGRGKLSPVGRPRWVRARRRVLRVLRLGDAQVVRPRASTGRCRSPSSPRPCCASRRPRASYAAALSASPFARATAAAQTSPAISAAIVLGDQPLWFSHRSCAGVGAVGDEVVGRLLDVRPVVGARAAEPPGEHDRQRDLVHLLAGPVLLAVDPRVLPPDAAGLLHPPEIVDHALRRGAVAGRLLRGRGVVEVARPDEVVGTRELVLLEPQRRPHPGHRRRGDRGAAIELVLERGQHEHGLLVDAGQLGFAARRSRAPG